MTREPVEHGRPCLTRPLMTEGYTQNLQPARKVWLLLHKNLNIEWKVNVLTQASVRRNNDLIMMYRPSVATPYEEHVCKQNVDGFHCVNLCFLNWSVSPSTIFFRKTSTFFTNKLNSPYSITFPLDSTIGYCIVLTAHFVIINSKYM